MATRSPEPASTPDPADSTEPERILDSPGTQETAPALASQAPAPPLSPRVDPRERIPGPHGGWIGKGGLPGNRGGRGRPHTRIIIRAGQNLERELARLERMAKDARKVKCPCCGNEFTPPVTGRMDTRDRIAYARLCADIKASGKGDDVPPLQILVATASAGEIIAHVGQPDAGVQYVDGDAEGGARDANARDPAMGPPEVPISGFPLE